MTENFAPHSPAVAPQARSLRRLRPAKAALYLGAMMACVGGLSASALHASVQGPPDGLIPAGPPTTSRPVVPVPTPAPSPAPTPAPTPAPSAAPNPAPSASGGDGPRVSVPVIQQLPTRSTAPARAPQVQTRPAAVPNAAPVRDRARDSAPAPRADGNGATRANAGDTPFSTLPTDSADDTAAPQSGEGAGVAASDSGGNAGDGAGAGDGFDTPVTTSVPVSSAASSTPEWLPLAALGALALLIGGLFWWRKSRNRPVSTVEEWAEPVALAAEPAPPPAPPPAPVIAQEAAVAPKPKAKGRAKKDAASQAPVDAEAALASVVPDATESVAVAAATAGAATAATIAQPRAPLGQRADLVIDFEPLTASSTLVNLRLRYAITLRNMGHSTAAPVLVRIGLFAGTMANEQGLLHWFQLDDGQVHERIEQMVPGESYRFEGELAAALDALNPMLIDGRRIAVPIVAVDARYNHDASAAPIEGQVARAFVVGRDSGAAGGKLAPFRFDLGPTSFTPLGQRDTGISRNE